MRIDPAAKDALIVLGHGSRRPEGLEVVILTAERMQERLGPQFAVMEAYMELAQPDLESAVQTLINRYPLERLMIMPLFLSMGTHVATQLPEAADRIRKQYSDIHIQVTRHIGADPLLSDIVLQRVEEVLQEETDWKERRGDP